MATSPQRREETTATFLAFCKRRLEDPTPLTIGLTQYDQPMPRFVEFIDLHADDSVHLRRLANALDLAADRFRKLHHAHLQAHQTTISQRRLDDRRAMQQSLGMMCRSIKGGFSMPLHRMRENVDGNEVYHTQPLEVV